MGAVSLSQRSLEMFDSTKGTNGTKDTKGTKGTKERQGKPTMLTRAISPLPAEVEELTGRIIGCALSVHTALGPGFVEPVYRNAMRIELRDVGLPFKSEHRILIKYKNQDVYTHRVDLMVADAVIVELKSVARIDSIHVAQVLSYLRATRLRVGLILNFNTDHLKGSIKRVVL